MPTRSNSLRAMMENSASPLPDALAPITAEELAINPATGGPVCNVVAGNPLDARLPKTPKYKVTFYPEYTYILGNQAALRAIVDFTYTAEMFNDVQNTPLLARADDGDEDG